jgi:hypothetical protein
VFEPVYLTLVCPEEDPCSSEGDVMGSYLGCFAGHLALEREMESRTMAMKTVLLMDLERVGLRRFDCWAEEPSEAPGTGMRSLHRPVS